MKKMNVPVEHSRVPVTYSSSEAEESSDTNIKESPFSGDLKPISYFINNRRKMLEEVFSVIDADKLRTMVPTFLKDVLLDELKVICYEELCALTDEDVMSILKGNHESGTTCGYEACKSEDTATSSDSRNKDILEIGISEEEVSCLLKEIPNSQDISKDSVDVTFQSKGTVCDSDKQHHISDDDSAFHRELLRMLEVGPKAHDEDLLELLELELRARSIRSLIMQCDAGEENEIPGVAENMPKINSQCAKINYVEHDNSEETNVHIRTAFQKHQELDCLLLAPLKVVVATSHQKKRRNLSSKNKQTPHDTLHHNDSLGSNEYTDTGNKMPGSCIMDLLPIHNNMKKYVNVTRCGDYIVTQNNLSESSITGVGAIHDGIRKDVTETVGYGSHQVATQELSCNSSVFGIGSVFQNSGQLHVTITASQGKKDLKKNSYSAEEMREKNIHKVVSTSKMCTKLRERIKRTNQLKRFKEDNTEAKTVILGTVEEYRSLNSK